MLIYYPNSFFTVWIATFQLRSDTACLLVSKIDSLRFSLKTSWSYCKIQSWLPFHSKLILGLLIKSAFKFISIVVFIKTLASLTSYNDKSISWYDLSCLIFFPIGYLSGISFCDLKPHSVIYAPCCARIAPKKSISISQS